MLSLLWQMAYFARQIVELPRSLHFDYAIKGNISPPYCLHEDYLDWDSQCMMEDGVIGRQFVTTATDTLY